MYKGSYPDTMNAGIAAFRAGQPPAILQVYEVGTATMMAAKGAIKPVYQLMAEKKEKFDPKAYIPTITGYYSTAKGEMLSMPFNSSTAVFYYNKDAFRKAGLNAEKPPKTWPELFEAARKLKAAGYEGGFTTQLDLLDPAGELLRLAQRALRDPQPTGSRGWTPGSPSTGRSSSST